MHESLGGRSPFTQIKDPAHPRSTSGTISTNESVGELPGGSEGAARLHVARAAARRAERAMTAMAAQHLTNRHALAYINRLSDYLFVLARVANDDGRADVKWVPGANR